MDTVLLEPFFHRGKEQLGIICKNDTTINNHLRRIPSIRWSKSHHCWYVGLSRSNYELVREVLKLNAHLDTTLLHEFLTRRRQIIQIKVAAAETPVLTPVNLVTYNISEHNLQELVRFIETLQLSARSESTIRTYKNEFTALLQTLQHRQVQDLSPDDLRQYLLFCMNELHLSSNTIHSRLNALKFYFEKVLHREKFFLEVPRPKRPTLLPNVLGEREMGRLFNAIHNKKHKAMLFTAYSAGLRVSEVIHLKLSDVDPGRMQLFIQCAKGRKDRFVMLSPVVLDVLRNYIRDERPRPRRFVFEGPVPGHPYTTRSAQQVFQNARRMAGIQKKVSFHGLRHSFATHLLEKGVDVKYIKELLGHFNIKTTERYLHVAREQLVNIRSPFDELWESGLVHW